MKELNVVQMEEIEGGTTVGSATTVVACGLTLGLSLAGQWWAVAMFGPSCAAGIGLYASGN